MINAIIIWEQRRQRPGFSRFHHHFQKLVKCLLLNITNIDSLNGAKLGWQRHIANDKNYDSHLLTHRLAEFDTLILGRGGRVYGHHEIRPVQRQLHGI